MPKYRRQIFIWIFSILIASLGSGCVSLSKYDDLEAGSNEEISKLHKEISALNAEKKSQELALTSEKKGLQEEIAGLKAQKADLEGKKVAVDQDFISLNDQLANTEKKEAEIKAQKEALDHDLIALNDQLAVAEKKGAENMAQKEALGHELAALKGRMASSEKLAAEIEARKEEELIRLKGVHDDLVKSLKEEVEKGKIQVTRFDDRLSINIIEKGLFDSGRASLKKSGKDLLIRVGKILRDIKDKEIRIEGYMDNEPVNGPLKKKLPNLWELSTQRAANVLRFLAEEAGLEETRLSAAGYGPFHPAAGNETPEGRAKNRRIEIWLIPPETRGAYNKVQ